MPNSKKNNTFNNKTIGRLKSDVFKQNKRIESLEKTNGQPTDGWSYHFNQKPWVVISSIVIILFGGFWAVFIWADNKNEGEITRLEKQHKEKIQWIKEQHDITVKSDKKQCQYDYNVLSNKQRLCVNELATIKNKK